MKIYTKTGDRGSTALIGGRRVSKDDDRIEAYGTLDELISFIGLLRDQDIEKHVKKILVGVQDNLMTCASILATDCTDCDMKLPKLELKEIEILETEIDEMEKKLPPLQSFIIPGGHQVVSFCHVSRTICRRAERQTIKLFGNVSDSELVGKYLNRLSDYLFVLARKLSKDFNAEEIAWVPKLD